MNMNEYILNLLLENKELKEQTNYYEGLYEAEKVAYEELREKRHKADDKNKQLEEELKQIKEKLSIEKKENLIYKNEFHKLKQGTKETEPVKKKHEDQQK